MNGDTALLNEDGIEQQNITGMGSLRETSLRNNSVRSANGINTPSTDRKMDEREITIQMSEKGRESSDEEVYDPESEGPYGINPNKKNRGGYDSSDDDDIGEEYEHAHGMCYAVKIYCILYISLY